MKATRYRSADHELDGRARPPRFSLWLELEERCNLDCVFCYNPWRGNPAESSGETLPKDRLIHALKLVASEIDVQYVTLSGGEPLMYPYLPDVMAVFKDHPASILMTTNGRSGTRARLNTLAAAGLQAIAVSLHSHQPAVHDRLTAATSWHAAVRTVALSMELGLDVALTCVLTRINLADVDGMCRLVELLGVKRLILNCFHATGQGVKDADSLRISNGEFDEAVQRARQRLAGKVPIRVGAPHGYVSRQQINRIVISPFGDVKFCNESSRGVVNLRTASDDAFTDILSKLRQGDHRDLMESIDHCTCAGR